MPVSATAMSAQSLSSALEERVALALRHPTMIESDLAGTHAREDFPASSRLLCANNLGSNSAPLAPTRVPKIVPKSVIMMQVKV